MNDTNDERSEAKASRKKAETTKEKNPPVKVIRHGAIAASIWQRQAQGGFTYHDFTISRAWKSQTGDKSGYSQSFFESNREALIQCIEEATAFIEAQQVEEQSGQFMAA